MRLTVPRAHPYRKPSASYTSRSLSRSPSSESSPLLSPSYSTSAPSTPALLSPTTYSHTMAQNNQNATPTIMINNAVATHIPIPRRISLPQSCAIKPGYRPNYRVSFKTNGVPGFRIGDALHNPNFSVDDGDTPVLATCADRKVHVFIDVSPKFAIQFLSSMLMCPFHRFLMLSRLQTAFIYLQYGRPTRSLASITPTAAQTLRRKSRWSFCALG